MKSQVGNRMGLVHIETVFFALPDSHKTYKLHETGYSLAIASNTLNNILVSFCFAIDTV